MTDTAADLAALRAAYPDLPILAVETIESGQYNRVLLLNGTLIARFPRFMGGAARLAFETSLLDTLRPHSPVPVPAFRYRQLASDGGLRPFVAYHKIAGEPLERDYVAALARDKQAQIAATLGGFLSALHTLPLDTLGTGPPPLAYGFTAGSWQDGWRDIAARLRRAVLPRVASATAARIETVLAPLTEPQGDWAPSLTLIHGDFGGGNILVDRATDTITGILDFGAAGLGDPACDLAALLTYGDQFANDALAAYPALRAALPRARAYRATFAVQEALYGAEHGDPGAFARGVAPYTGGDPVRTDA